MARKEKTHVELSKTIDQLRSVNAELMQADQDLQETLRIARIGRWEYELDTHLLKWSDSVFELFEIDPAEFEPTYEFFLNSIHPDDRDLVDRSYKESLKNQTPYEITHRLIMKDGRIKWVNELCRTLYSEQGEPLRSIGIVQDITNTKQAELALIESEKKYHTILQTAMDGYWLVDFQGRIIEVNEAYCRMSGYSEQELLGMKIADVEALENEEDVRARQDRIHIYGGDRFESQHIGKDGRIFDVEVSIKYNNHSGDQYAVFLRDITEHKEAREALLESDVLLKKLSYNVPGMIYQFVRRADGSYCVPFSSDGIASVFGCSQEDVREDFTPAAKVVYHEDIEKLVSSIEKSAAHLSPWRCEYRVQVPGKPIRWMYGQSTPEKLEDGSVIWHGYNTDITEQKQAEEEKFQLEEQLRQAQKMESVGRLAGGVAHDFNNMLGVILGHTDIALNVISSSHPITSNLEEIRKATIRSADLTRQLLAFARKQTISPKVMNLNDIISGMMKMLHRLIGEHIDLAWLPGHNLWSVNVDPSQIDQILVNLCVNARDAISDIGQIIIETDNCTLDNDYCSRYAGLEPGDYVLLSVSDNGCGMDKETVKNIFEPFFTTKKIGDGTGLGLSMVYGAIKQNNGFVDVYSESGHGATFKVYLPRFEGTNIQIKSEASEKQTQNCSETILLVEDEPAILKMTKELLESEGYRVLVANTPGEAVRIAQDNEGQIDMLMTDVVMPEMNGPELARILSSTVPNLKCLYNSGYTADVIAHQGVLDEGLNFIHKPFSLEELSMKLRDIFDNQ